MNTAVNKQIFFDDFEVDATRRLLLKDGQVIALKPKAFDLLVALIERHGEIVSKNDLLEAVWEDQFVEEKNLTVHIAALRKIFGERKDENRFIATIPGTGYKFVAPLNHSPAGIIIETEKIQRITIEEEFIEEPKNRQLAGNVYSIRKSSFYLLTLTVLLSMVGIFVWKNSGRTKTEPLSARRLTTNGTVRLTVLSRDGKFFAYSILEKGGYRTELRIGQTDGSSDVALIPMNEAVYYPTAFSADGSWLYYVKSKPRGNHGTLYKTPVLGGVSEKLADEVNNYITISPDEKQIAFGRNNAEKKTSSLVVANLDGTNERELVVLPIETGIYSLGLAWSPDASLIAFGGTQEKSGKREIFLANVADGYVTQLTTFDWFELLKLEWLKDKSGLLAVARDAKTTLSTKIWQIAYPSGAVQPITGDVSKYGSTLSVSANSLGLVTVQVITESNIWIAPSEDFKSARQITFGSIGRQDGWNGLDWTPDGRLVYSARNDQSLTIWIINADGTNARQLTPHGFSDRRINVSADGSFIVFDSNRSGQSEIWRVGTDGSGLQQLTTDGGNLNPSIGPDGQTLVYEHSTKDGNSIRRQDLKGGEPINLTNQNGSNPRLSPDGKYVACGYSSGGKRKLAILSIEGGEPLKLFSVPPTHNFDNTAIRWTPDGRFINYRDWSNGIWQQSIEGGDPVRLQNLPQEKFYTYGWAPDSKKFAFVRGQEIRDVILINNFR